MFWGVKSVLAESWPLELLIGAPHIQASFCFLSSHRLAYLLKALSVEPTTFFPSLSSLLHILF